MNQECPITGDPSGIAEASARVIVDHPRFGGYSVDASALPLLGDDRELRKRLMNWIAESHALDVDIPHITTEHIHLFERLADLEAGVSEWTEHRGGMSSIDRDRLWRKLRLEWNYNSNHIEGNTLTYHETELLLIHGRTAGGHPMRDYEEMKAHDVAIGHARRLAGEERILGEGDIRDLNRILLKEPFSQRAETQDGQPTQMLIVPGKYKVQPNHVRTATGELHRFAEPEETPALMARWTHSFQRDMERTGYPLPLFLAESHCSFLRIHPFGDGNGRTSRLLANYALLRRGLPPIVIKSTERDLYIGALQEADLGHMMPLAHFMLDNVLWSTQLAVRAAKGESIRETDDVDKEIAVFVRRHRASAPSSSDLEVLDDTVRTWIRPMLERAEKALQPLDRLFARSHRASFVRRGRHRAPVAGNMFTKKGWERAREKYFVKPGLRITDEQPVELGRLLRFHQYVGRGVPAFDVELSMGWKLDGASVSFTVCIERLSIARTDYHVSYSDLEVHEFDMDRTVDVICKAMMDRIERHSKEQNWAILRTTPPTNRSPAPPATPRSPSDSSSG